MIPNQSKTFLTNWRRSLQTIGAPIGQLAVSLCFLSALIGCTETPQESDGTIPADTNKQDTELLNTNPSSPNIVIFYIDDLGWGDLSVYGATGVKTPEIDRIANEGIRFTDGHSSSATCTPSRYSLLTGEHAFRNNAEILGKVWIDQKFIRSGYQTVDQLYDLNADPEEINNIAQQYPQQVEELKQRINDIVNGSY